MAKRKAGRATGTKKAAPKRTARSASAAARRKTGAAARASAKASARSRRSPARGGGRKAATGRAKPPARKQTAKSKRRTVPARAVKRVKAAKATRPAVKATTTTARRSAPAKKTAPRRSSAQAALPPRKAPALNRERRVVRDDEDIVQSTPPSSLDLDRSASAVRSGRRNLRDRFNEHTETSPALTGGDVDADWESAYSVGDEAPGGDNPTPDQDIVDDIGRAVGIEYQDNEELKGADKLEKRDKNRWELDPASSEDWDER